MCPSSCMPSIPISDIVYTVAMSAGSLTYVLANSPLDRKRPSKNTKMTAVAKNMKGRGKRRLLTLSLRLLILNTEMIILLSFTGNLISDIRVGIDLEKYFDLLALALLCILTCALRKRRDGSLVSSS